MSDPNQVIAASFVEPRGMMRSVVGGVAGGQVGGLVGNVIGSAAAPAGVQGATPLQKGQLGYLAVYPAQLVLFRGKRGAFKPKPTGEVIVSAPRSAIRSAAVDKGKIGAVLEIAFSDGSAWQFDIARVNLNSAQRVAGALG